MGAPLSTDEGRPAAGGAIVDAARRTLACPTAALFSLHKPDSPPRGADPPCVTERRSRPDVRASRSQRSMSPFPNPFVRGTRATLLRGTSNPPGD